MSRATKVTKGQNKAVTGLFTWWEIVLMMAALLLIAMLQ